LSVSLAHFAAFGWLGVREPSSQSFVLIGSLRQRPTNRTRPARAASARAFNLNDDPNPWYMQSQYRFGSGNSAAHNRWHK
jgi:hypothetical protein